MIEIFSFFFCLFYLECSRDVYKILCTAGQSLGRGLHLLFYTSQFLILTKVRAIVLSKYIYKVQKRKEDHLDDRRFK